MALGMRADKLQRTGEERGAILADVVVITDATEATAAMGGFKSFGS